MLPSLTGAGPHLDSLPSVLEVKTLLDGRRKQFACRAIERSPGGLVVLFISDQEYVIGRPAGYGAGTQGPPALVLPAGTITFGHFWTTRPYNVYHWQTPEGHTLAHYFNLASDTAVSAGGDLLTWRDLTLDVLVTPGAAPRILDEHELPTDLAPPTRQIIDHALATVLAEHQPCIDQLETVADRLWPALFSAPRGGR